MAKTGKRFEELVSWIEQCLHDTAKVTPNAKLPDKDTGKLRQIDVLIELEDGPTKILIMVEARDRSRKFGVPALEALVTKRDSVGVDAACIVSSEGFTKTALEKAPKHRIRTFTFEGAKNYDWRGWLRARWVEVLQPRWGGHLDVSFLDDEERIIRPHESVIAAHKNDPNAQIIVDSEGTPVCDLHGFANSVFRILDTKKAFPNLTAADGKRRERVLVRYKFKPRIFILDDAEATREIKGAMIEADLWLERTTYPLSVGVFADTEQADCVAQTAEAEIEIGGGRFLVQMLAEGAGENIPVGAKFATRTTALGDGT